MGEFGCSVRIPLLGLQCTEAHPVLFQMAIAWSSQKNTKNRLLLSTLRYQLYLSEAREGHAPSCPYRNFSEEVQSFCKEEPMLRFLTLSCCLLMDVERND